MSTESLQLLTDELRQARDRVLDALQSKPQSLTELANALKKQPKIGSNDKRRKELVKEAVESLLKENQLYEHPKGGRNKSVRYGLTPPDPKLYVNKSGLKQLQSVYQRLLKAKVPPEEIVAAASAKLSPPVYYLKWTPIV